MIYDIWVHVIHYLPFVDCFKKRLVCQEFNNIVIKRFQKLENYVASQFTLALLGFKNDWWFHISIEKCNSCDSIRSLSQTDLVINFDVICKSNHGDWNNYCSEVSYIDNLLYFWGGNNLYTFSGREFKILTKYKNNVEQGLFHFIFPQSEIWSVKMNQDLSIIIKKDDGSVIQVKDVIMNGDYFPDACFNEYNHHRAKNALVFEGYDGDYNVCFVQYINLTQQIGYYFNMGNHGARPICWTDQFLLMETDTHIVQFFPFCLNYTFKKKNAFLSGRVYISSLFHLFNSDNKDEFFCPEPYPHLDRFDEMEDDNTQILNYYESPIVVSVLK